MNFKKISVVALLAIVASTAILTLQDSDISLFKQVEALKGQGVEKPKYGSAGSVVCGDRLCSEAHQETTQSKTMMSNIDGSEDDSHQAIQGHGWNNVHENVQTSFNEIVVKPEIESEAFIHPFAVVIGNCHIGKMVFVAPTAVCRGDEGTPIHVNEGSNMQDGVVIHALETTDDGHNIDGRKFTSNGERLNGSDSRFAKEGYAVWVGENVSLAHGSMIHGPAWIGNDSFVGMEAMIFNAKIGNNVAVGVSATITGGVEIPDGKFVPPGKVITTQAEADALPDRIGSPYENTNHAVLHVNQQLAEEYDQIDLEKMILERERMMEKGMMETSMPHP